MNLLIDWGNTHLKYMLIGSLEKGPQVIIDSYADVGHCDSPHELMSVLPESLDQVLVCSVRADKDNLLLKSLLQPKVRALFFAKTEKQTNSVNCGYSNPQQMGADRWLAVLGGHERILAQHSQGADPVKTLAILDIGSAITLDLVQVGQHLGGQILPGKNLMLESLKLTGKVRPSSEEIESNQVFLGTSTYQCVQYGVDCAIEGYLNLLIERVNSSYPRSYWLLLGGGAKYWIEQPLFSSFSARGDMEYLPSLVFEGLILAFLDSKSLG
ncbi:type III pantothenate kinase [Aliikangiella sp. G2MR2-5]|uniref:type III pantothenate kinase n=1 Tax=Aliikangiella sp. G2MR2-5 TaxID=2788943 RepID=UPI0018A97DA7|nr:type III pantothenate kinase [Aliikangiella sp. G2MR2-5]